MVPGDVFKSAQMMSSGKESQKEIILNNNQLLIGPMNLKGKISKIVLP